MVHSVSSSSDSTHWPESKINSELNPNPSETLAYQKILLPGPEINVAQSPEAWYHSHPYLT
jgi:hypothetical protein